MSVAADVRELVRSDPVLHEAVARGIINLQSAARWLVEYHRLEATVDSVAGALKRIAAAKSSDWYGTARAVLRASHINTRGDLASVSVPNSGRAQHQLQYLLREIQSDRGDVFRVISCDRGFKIIVDEARLKCVLTSFGSAGVDEILHGLTEFSIVMPPVGATTPGVLALVCSALASSGVNISETAAAVHQHIVFVETKDARLAYETLLRLIQPTRQGSVRVIPEPIPRDEAQARVGPRWMDRGAKPLVTRL